MHSPAWLSVVSVLSTEWFLVFPTASFCRLQITCSLLILSVPWGWALPLDSPTFLFLVSNVPGLKMPGADRWLPSLCFHLPHPSHSSPWPNKSTLFKCFTLWLKILQFLCDILTVLVNTDAQGNNEQRYGLPHLAYLPSSSLKTSPALTENIILSFYFSRSNNKSFSCS